MRLLFLSFFLILLAVVLIRAISVSVDDEDNDEADFDSSTEDENVGKMKKNPQLELMREKLKKLKIANAARARHKVMHAPLQMMMPRRSSYRNITHPVFASIEKINERIVDYLYQSDILLTLEQVDDLLSQNTLTADENDKDSDSSSSKSASEEMTHHPREKRKAKSNRQYKWSTKKPISYYVSADLTPTKKQVIVSAVNFWQHHTCLTFREVETLEADTDLIHFLNGAGCFSSIGRVGGSQQLSVADGCEHLGFGILSHEIGHALGFWHEQARSDRDRFVKVLMENIQSVEKGNFDKQAAYSIKTYDIPYEYGSIMHYGVNAFAINENVNVLVATNQLFQQTMGQRTAPTFFDVYQANRHYKCLDKCGATMTSCQNGGYPNPKNCSKCICPTGFGGNLCSDPQTTQGENCGQRLTATEDWQLLEASVGKNLPWRPTENNPAIWQPVVCSWNIATPIGKTVEVRVSENSAQCNFGCTLNALQIKTSINYKMTGMRVCCRNDNRNYIYQSEGNIMPIIAEAYYRFSFKLQYRISPEDSEKSRDEMSTTEPANEPYQENECHAAGGVCKYSDDCNSGITDAMLCPKQSKSIHCCLAPSETTTAARPKATGWNVFQEKECRAADGICQSSTRPCRGTSQGIFCPRQADATCCIPPFQEALCEAALGQCKHTSECGASLSVSALCPTQSDDVKCCIAYRPHQEIQCAAVGGKCTIAAPSACSRGRLLPSLCPMQPAGVACCAPRRPFQEQACQNAGGVCKYSTSCRRGIRFASLCPLQSTNIACCIRNSYSNSGMFGSNSYSYSHSHW